MEAWLLALEPWKCVLPPLLTIVLAIATRRVVPSLLFGILSAIAILQPSPAAQRAAWGEEFSWLRYLTHSAQQMTSDLTEGHLWPSLVDEDHLRVFVFTAVLGMQVALIHRSGGMAGIVNWMGPLARTRRGGQVLTWVLGMVIFIDDYANTLLLGSTMRPLTDRLKISREKLAYLVDSTAAPVSGLALVSTWVATEISSMQTGFESAGVDIGNETFGIFVQTIPVRFYILYTLVFVLLCGLLCRDFGPMLTAERAAANDDDSEAEFGTPSAATSAAGHNATQAPGASGATAAPQAMNAIVPILVTVAVAIGLLVQTGLAANAGQPLSDSAWQAAGQIIGQGDSYLALVYAALAGLGVILALILMQGRLAMAEVHSGLVEGFLHILPALVILWLAWTLSALTDKDHLRTGEFLASTIAELELHPGFMPTIIFCFASAIAFSTGTSWGTMAILMPIAIPMVLQLVSGRLGTPAAPSDPVVVATIGSVLAGAIFGDHCSPISDTTILSSRSSHCDHIAHVRTQMPYALTVGLIAILCGTLPAGFGVSSWWLLPCGVGAMLFVLLAFGRKV